MSRPRTASRKDGNHAALVRYWLSLGGTSWLETYQLPGALDGVAGYLGLDVRVEIKDPTQDANKRKLTAAELKTFAEWKGRPCIVWETVDDVDATRRRLMADALKVKGVGTADRYR